MTDDKPEPQTNKTPALKENIIRLVTVFAYASSVSMAALCLSSYYVFFWEPKPPGPGPPVIHPHAYVADPYPPLKLVAPIPEAEEQGASFWQSVWSYFQPEETTTVLPVTSTKSYTAPEEYITTMFTTEDYNQTETPSQLMTILVGNQLNKTEHDTSVDRKPTVHDGYVGVIPNRARRGMKTPHKVTVPNGTTAKTSTSKSTEEDTLESVNYITRKLTEVTEITKGTTPDMGTTEKVTQVTAEVTNKQEITVSTLTKESQETLSTVAPTNPDKITTKNPKNIDIKETPTTVTQTTLNKKNTEVKLFRRNIDSNKGELNKVKPEPLDDLDKISLTTLGTKSTFLNYSEKQGNENSATTVLLKGTKNGPRTLESASAKFETVEPVSEIPILGTPKGVLKAELPTIYTPKGENDNSVGTQETKIKESTIVQNELILGAATTQDEPSTATVTQDTHDQVYETKTPITDNPISSITHDDKLSTYNDQQFQHHMRQLKPRRKFPGH